MSKKNIMKEFVITEISAVDRPAQAGAVVSIIKRADPERITKRPPTLQEALDRVAAKGAWVSNLTEETDMDKHDQPRAFDTLADAAAEIRRREGLSRTMSMQKARERRPDLYAKVQSGAESSPPLASPSAIAKAAIAKWDELVDRIAHFQKCSRTAAMERARKAHPEAYAALQG